MERKAKVIVLLTLVIIGYVVGMIRGYPLYIAIWIGVNGIILFSLSFSFWTRIVGMAIILLNVVLLGLLFVPDYTGETPSIQGIIPLLPQRGYGDATLLFDDKDTIIVEGVSPIGEGRYRVLSGSITIVSNGYILLENTREFTVPLFSGTDIIGSPYQSLFETKFYNRYGNIPRTYLHLLAFKYSLYGNFYPPFQKKYKDIDEYARIASRLQKKEISLIPQEKEKIVPFLLGRK